MFLKSLRLRGQPFQKNLAANLNKF